MICFDVECLCYVVCFVMDNLICVYRIYKASTDREAKNAKELSVKVGDLIEVFISLFFHCESSNYLNTFWIIWIAIFIMNKYKRYFFLTSFINSVRFSWLCATVINTELLNRVNFFIVTMLILCKSCKKSSTIYNWLVGLRWLFRG